MQDHREAALAAATPTSSVGEPHLHHRRGINPGAILWHAALVIGALWMFVIALQLIKNGAGGLKPVLDAFAVDGVLGHLGFGWIGSYIVMSGSPVAAVSLSLFSGGIQDDLETFAMINGSRLGASLIVLVVGFISYITGRRNPDGLYIGVVALLVAITLWTPVVPIGVLILDQGWLEGVRIESPGVLTSSVSYISDPAVKPLVDLLPTGLLFLSGIGLLMLAFTVFDRALPQLEAPGERIEGLSKTLQHRYAMFLFGTLVTLITLSVSLSVTILVPLALKGYVHRDRVIPYVMGANIATWIDTLFAALLLNSPQAFTIVLTEMIAGASVSLFVLFFLYKPYNALILASAHKVSSSRGHMIAFLAFLFVSPILLIAISAARSML